MLNAFFNIIKNGRNIQLQEILFSFVFIIMQIHLSNDKRNKLKICCWSLNTYPDSIPNVENIIMVLRIVYWTVSLKNVI